MSDGTSPTIAYHRPPSEPDLEATVAAVPTESGGRRYALSPATARCTLSEYRAPSTTRCTSIPTGRLNRVIGPGPPLAPAARAAAGSNLRRDGVHRPGRTARR